MEEQSMLQSKQKSEISIQRIFKTKGIKLWITQI